MAVPRSLSRTAPNAHPGSIRGGFVAWPPRQRLEAGLSRACPSTNHRSVWSAAALERQPTAENRLLRSPGERLTQTAQGDRRSDRGARVEEVGVSDSWVRAAACSARDPPANDQSPSVKEHDRGEPVVDGNLANVMPLPVSEDCGWSVARASSVSQREHGSIEQSEGDDVPTRQVGAWRVSPRTGPQIEYLC